MSFKKVLGITFGVFVGFGAIVVIYMLAIGGGLPIYSYNTLEELCLNKDEIFWQGNWRNIRDEQIRTQAQARMDGSSSMGLMTFELNLNNQITDKFMKEQSINPQLRGDVFILIGSQGGINHCLSVEKRSELVESAEYYQSIGGYQWKNTMYDKLEQQKRTQNCAQVSEKLDEIREVESNLFPYSKQWNEVNSLKKDWMLAKNWICP